MTTTPPPNGLGWRVADIERRVGKLEDQHYALAAEMAAVRTDVRNMTAEVAKLDREIRAQMESLRASIQDETRNLRRALWAVCGSAIVGLLVVAVSQLGGTG